MTTSNYIAIHKEADITPDGLYRYALRRSWDPAARRRVPGGARGADDVAGDPMSAEAARGGGGND